MLSRAELPCGLILHLIKVGASDGCCPCWLGQGRPSVPDGDNRKPTRFELRLPAALGDAIDRWRREQADIPTRAEAARRLIEIGLESLQKPEKKA